MPIRSIKRKLRLKGAGIFDASYYTNASKMFGGALSNFRKKSGDFKKKSQILSQIFQMSHRPYTKRIPLKRRGRGGGPGVPMRAVLTKATFDRMRSVNISNSNR